MIFIKRFKNSYFAVYLSIISVHVVQGSGKKCYKNLGFLKNGKLVFHSENKALKKAILKSFKKGEQILNVIQTHVSCVAKINRE